MSLDPAVRERAAARVGATIRGKYRLDRLAGTGGMGAVYAATHRNGSRVALKVLHAELARYPEVRDRFLREGYIANKIAHPGVTRVIDDDDDDDGATVFLVLELLEGENLEERRTRLGGRLPLVDAVELTAQTLDVLAAAHAQAIVHRDVKPANLFATQAGPLKVLDFGIARLLDGTGATRTGQRMGTPAFMCPEQASGRVREIDARSDVWSAGAVLFTLLTGAEVHPARTRPEQEIYAATQNARPVESLATWLPRDLAAVVNKALAFHRDERWPSAAAMRAALLAAVAAVSPGASPARIRDEPSPPASPKRRRR